MYTSIVSLLCVLAFACGAATDPATPAASPPASVGAPTAPRGPWENPFVVAVADGYVLNEGGGVDAPAVHIAPDELKARVAALPASAWKQGRKIGLQPQSIVTAKDLPKIDANFERAKTVLAGMGLEVVLFPTA
jgi:hypothetical protein